MWRLELNNPCHTRSTTAYSYTYICTYLKIHHQPQGLHLKGLQLVWRIATCSAGCLVKWCILIFTNSPQNPSLTLCCGNWHSRSMRAFTYRYSVFHLRATKRFTAKVLLVLPVCSSIYSTHAIAKTPKYPSQWKKTSDLGWLFPSATFASLQDAPLQLLRITTSTTLKVLVVHKV